MEEPVDHEARHKADKALDAMESHEKLCTERWAQSRKVFEELVTKVTTGFAKSEDSRSRLHARIDGVNDNISLIQKRVMLWALGILGAGIVSLASAVLYLGGQIAQMKGFIPS